MTSRSSPPMRAATGSRPGGSTCRRSPTPRSKWERSGVGSGRVGRSAPNTTALAAVRGGPPQLRGVSAQDRPQDRGGDPRAPLTPLRGWPLLEVEDAERAGVAHLVPDPRLRHRQHLADVVTVVMDPLAEKLVDAELADLRVDPAATEIRRLERPNEVDAGGSERRDLVRQLCRRPCLVVPRGRDGWRIPRLEERWRERPVGSDAAEDGADTVRESASFRLDSGARRTRWRSTHRGAGRHLATSPSPT